VKKHTPFSSAAVQDDVELSGFHGASVKVSSRRITPSLPVDVVMARS
jgi:hypothetical protein